MDREVELQHAAPEDSVKDLQKVHLEKSDDKEGSEAGEEEHTDRKDASWTYSRGLSSSGK